MSAVAITVCLPVAPPKRIGRLLAQVVVASKREARRFMDRNADTWRCALDPGELRFVAIATDRNGAVVLVREYGRELGAPGTEHGRAALFALRETTTPKTTKRGTTK